MKIMRIKRRRVILLGGFLVVLWMLIVLMTPPPSESQSRRNHNREDDEYYDLPKRFRTSAYVVRGRLDGGEKKYRNGNISDFDDFAVNVNFDDFQPDVSRNDSTGFKIGKKLEKFRNISKQLQKINSELQQKLSNNSSSQKLIQEAKSKIISHNSYMNNSGLLLDIEKDLVPKNVDLAKTKPIILWETAASWVKSREIYPEAAPQFGDVLHALSTSPIIKADIGYKGTQLKARLTLEGGQMVVFKPKRFSRDHVIYGTPYAGYDRHNGEIASFHLDRVLGFRRAPLVAGRVVNLKTEITPVATKTLLDTFMNNGSDLCFYGKCYYCRPEEPACAQGDIMEGSVTLWLPKDRPLKKWRHLWARTYRSDIKARWETDKNYCETAKASFPMDRFPTILDMIDAAVFDYLIGNADRHQYETFEADGSEGMLLLLDNAKSFGNPHHDEKSILAPLYQCCRIRKSLWEQLQTLKNGVLSKTMRQVLSHDPIAPILTEKHLRAMDRRLEYILVTVMKCFENHSKSVVLQ